MAIRRHILAQGLLSLGLLASSGTALAQTPYDYPATTQVLREVFAVVDGPHHLGQVLRHVAPNAAVDELDGAHVAAQRVVSVFRKSLAVHEDGADDHGVYCHKITSLKYL